MKTLLFTLLLPCTVCAQQICPIRIDKFTADGNTTIQYTNMTEKVIAATVLHVSAVNGLGEEQDLVYGYEYNLDGKKGIVQPNGQFKTKFYSDEFHYGQGDFKLWVYGVRFQDGTVWKDDDSRSCFAMRK